MIGGMSHSGASAVPAGVFRQVVLPRLMIVGAAVLWSISGLFVKNDLFASWPEPVRGGLLAFWRALFATVVLLPFVRQVRWRPGLVPMSLCFVGMNICYLTSMTWTTAANAIWLQSTAPMWVCLLSWWLFGTRVASRDVLPLVLCTSGIGLILFYELQVPGAWQGNGPAGVALGLASGVFYAGAVMALHYLSRENTIFLVALNHLVAAAVLLPFVVWNGIWPDLRQLLYLAAFGALQMGIPYLLFVRGLRTVNSQEATLLGLLEPVLVPLWVHFVLRNPETRWWSLAGGGLILLGLLIRYGVPLLRRSEAEGDRPLAQSAVAEVPVASDSSQGAE